MAQPTKVKFINKKGQWVEETCHDLDSCREHSEAILRMKKILKKKPELAMFDIDDDGIITTADVMSVFEEVEQDGRNEEEYRKQVAEAINPELRAAREAEAVAKALAAQGRNPDGTLIDASSSYSSSDSKQENPSMLKFRDIYAAKQKELILNKILALKALNADASQEEIDAHKILTEGFKNKLVALSEIDDYADIDNMYGTVKGQKLLTKYSFQTPTLEEKEEQEQELARRKKTRERSTDYSFTETPRRLMNVDEARKHDEMQEAIDNFNFYSDLHYAANYSDKTKAKEVAFNSVVDMMGKAEKVNVNIDKILDDNDFSDIARKFKHTNKRYTSMTQEEIKDFTLGEQALEEIRIEVHFKDYATAAKLQKRAKSMLTKYGVNVDRIVKEQERLI